MKKICNLFSFGKNEKVYEQEPVETPSQLTMKSYDYKDLIKEAYEISKNSNDFMINCNLAILSPEICPIHKINAYLLMSLAAYRCEDVENLKIIFENVEELLILIANDDLNRLLVSILKIYYRYGKILLIKEEYKQAYEVSQKVNNILSTHKDNQFVSKEMKIDLNNLIEECKHKKGSVITSQSSEKTITKKRVFIIKNKEELIKYNFGFPVEAKSLSENYENLYKIDPKTEKEELLYKIFLNLCSGVNRYYIPENKLHKVLDKTDLQDENDPFYILDCAKFIQIKSIEPFFQTIGDKEIITQKHCGLDNLGNTCYFNSCLHCIYNCKLLSDMFMKLEPQKGRLVKEYIDFINENQKNKSKSISPADVRKAFVLQNQKFNNYSQQDSMECMIDFLNTMNNELKDPYSRYFYSKSDDPLTQAWTIQLNLSDSFITKLCYGVIKYTIGDNETKYEPTLCLLLPIKETNKNSVNIDECLQKFKNSVIRLTNRTEVTCQSSIVKLPYYLIIYLKRFYLERFRFLKNDICVEYPEVLDITDYVDESVKTDFKKKYKFLSVNEKNPKDPDTTENVDESDKQKLKIKYKLLSVNEHNGGLFGGHYTAICRGDQGWVKYNDSSVSKVKNCKSSKAFGLVYYLCNEK